MTRGRWLSLLALPLLWAPVACGGSGEPISARPVRFFVGGVEAHNPDASFIHIAVRFDPTPLPEDEVKLEVVEVKTEDVHATQPIEKASSVGTGCGSATSDADLHLFELRGPQAALVISNSASYQLRVSLKRGDNQRHFDAQMPLRGCYRFEVEVQRSP